MISEQLTPARHRIGKNDLTFILLYCMFESSYPTTPSPTSPIPYQAKLRTIAEQSIPLCRYVIVEHMVIPGKHGARREQTGT